MDTFEYTIVEKLVLNEDDLEKFTQLVENYLNAGWAPSAHLVITEQVGMSRKFYQPLIRITRVKKTEQDAAQQSGS